MNVDVSIELFRDVSETPPYYWVTISTDYDTEEVMLKNGGNVSFVATTNASGNYELDVMVESCEDPGEMQCPVVHLVLLGNLSTTGPDCGVDIDVLHENERVGGGLPKLANATQTTRPIPKLIH